MTTMIMVTAMMMAMAMAMMLTMMLAMMTMAMMLGRWKIPALRGCAHAASLPVVNGEGRHIRVMLHG